MPEEEPPSDPFGGGPFTYAEPYDQIMAWAVELTRHTGLLGEPPDQVAARLKTLYDALKGLSRVEQTADPPA